MAALVLATSFLSTPFENEAQLVIYGSAPRRAGLQQTVVIKMTIDAVNENHLQQRAPLKNVKMRLPRSLFKKFAFVALDPKPDMISTTAGGRYFFYDSLARESTLKLRLYARTSGQHSARAAVYADEHLSGSYRFSILIAPALIAPATRP